MIDYFVGIGILGVIPVFIGPNKLLRIFGCLAVYLSLHFAATDYFIGKRDAERFNRRRDLKATTMAINCEPPNTRSPSAQGVGGRRNGGAKKLQCAFFLNGQKTSCFRFCFGSSYFQS